MQKSRMQVLAVTGGAQGIGRACVFLAQEAGFVTGQNLTLDGGMSVKMIYED